MFKLIKRNENVEYTLRLGDILTIDDSVICVFTEKGGITPLKLTIEEIFSNVKILRNIHPETIIALRKIYEMNEMAKNKLKLLSILNQNEFEVCYDGKLKTKISGKDFCTDISIASMMDIKDAIKVIYNTAFNEAFLALTTLEKNNNLELSNKECAEENYRNILRIVK